MKRLPSFNSIDQISKFLKTNKNSDLKVEIISKKDKYLCINEILWNIRFRKLSLYKKHIVFKLLKFFTGYSLSHLKRLSSKWRNGILKYNISRNRNKFSRKYFSTDIKLLIDTDIAHCCLSGEATKRVLKRMVKLENITITGLHLMKNLNHWKT